MRKWQLQEARDRLSEVVDLAIEEGPQVVTRHGKEVAVIVGREDFARRRGGRTARRGTLLTFLRKLSLRDANLDFDRARDRDRDLGW